MANWVTNKNLIQKLYIAFYGRPADPSGLRYWASQLPDNAAADSPAVRQLISGFINSAEAQSRFGNPDLNAVIDRVINFAFHRDATAADRQGINNVVDLLVRVVSVSSGSDYASLNNKLQYANWFVDYLDPNGDGIANDDPTGTKFTATYSGNTDASNIAAKLNFIDATNPPTQAMVLNDIKTVVADSGDPILQVPTTPGITYILTTNADAVPGTPGDDIIVATEATLSSADIIDGSGGDDLFRYASSGTGPITEAGFEIKNVETIQITSDATGGTTFDFTGTSGVKTIRNFNSSQDLNITGLKTLAPTIEIDSLGAKNRATNIVDTIITYDVSAVSGDSDAIQINVRGNLNTDGTRVGSVVANGIEIFNIKSYGSPSAFDGIYSNKLREMNITGDKDLTLAGAEFFNTAAVNIVNASKFEGNLNITLENSGAANIDVAVTGGKGNDRADFSAGFDKNDAFDGGDGTDTLALTNAVAVNVNPADFGTVKNVEILEITNGGTDIGVNVLDMDNFSGVGTVYYSGINQAINNGLVGSTTIQDTPNTFTVKVNNPNNQNLTVNVKTDGASDTLNLSIEKLATAGEKMNVVTAAKFETVNLEVLDDAADVGTGRLTIAQLSINGATTLNITGSASLVITNDGNPATPVLTTLNAGKLTGGLTLTGVDLAASGATVILGSGNDTINVATAKGADLYDITAGGKDTIVYSAVAQSDKNMDTIKGFTSGEDVVDVRNLLGGIGIANSSQFVGNRPTFAQAQGALLGGGKLSAVFQQDEQILWVDADGNGTLDNNDFRVRLDGVSSVVARDLGFEKGVTFTANKAGFSTLIASHSFENNAVTPEDDVIIASVAQINNPATIIDGKLGNDVLNITGTSAPGEIADLQSITFTNVETVNLDSTVEGVKMDKNDLGNAAGQTSTIKGASGTLQSLEVNMGSNISNVNISNIEILKFTNNVRMTVDQHNAFMLIMAPGPTDVIQLTTAGNLTAYPDVEIYDLIATGTYNVTLTKPWQSVYGSYVVDQTNTVITGGLQVLTGEIDLGDEGGDDTLRVTGKSVDISSATLNKVDILRIDDDLDVTMKVSQHNSFSSIVAPGENAINLIDGGTLTADPDIEIYNLLADSATYTITLTSPWQSIRSQDDDQTNTVITNGLSSLKGDIILGNAGGADTLHVTIASVDLSQANLQGIEILQINNNLNVAMTANQFNSFMQFSGAAGIETFTITDKATNLIIDQTSSNNVKFIENFVFKSTGSDSVTFKFAPGSTISHTVDISAGGSDTITIYNETLDNNNNSGFLTIKGFNVSNDTIVSQLFIGGSLKNHNAGFQEITKADTDLTVAANSVIEINSAVGQYIDYKNLSAVETIIANAIDEAPTGSYTVIVYGSEGAALYHIFTTAGGFNLTTGNTTIELIGLITGIAENSLSSTNFA